MNIKESLEFEVNKLKEKNIEEGLLKAKILLSFILNVQKEYLVINSNQELTQNELETFNNYIERLILGEPIQYITGKQEFFGLEFIVNKNVLIPQPDTEILVEEAISIIKKENKTKVLDLCTGSGAIGTAIAKHIENANVYLSDISKEALKIANTNFKNITEKNANIIESDLFKNINDKFDIIVSNPPYIKTSIIKTLSKEVQNEPMLALDGGESGLEFYKRIIDEAYNYLEEDGYLCLEIGYDQKEEVIDLIKNTNKYKDVYSKKDLAENDRIITAKNCQKVIE